MKKDDARALMSALMIYTYCTNRKDCEGCIFNNGKECIISDKPIGKWFEEGSDNV